MEVVETIAALRERRRAWYTQGRQVGVVLTMGALHAGHLALVAAARAENERVITTIFVNPLQFNEGDDFSRYPRTIERDSALLEAAGVDLLLLPTVTELYPPGFATTVNVAEVTEPFEGALRPGHFTGVATVVTKFFAITQPDRTYFGQKDAQQVAVVRRFITDLNLPIELRVVPTVRSDDGLALSSRNVQLNPAERAAAPVLYRGLTAARDRWLRGERAAAALCAAVTEVVEEQPLLALEYIAVVDPDSMTPRDGAALDGGGLLVLAARCGPIRLIDNLPL